MANQFTWGILAGWAFVMTVQDWYGLDGYIEMIRRSWVDLPWWVGASVLVVSVAFGVRKKT